MPPAAPRKLVFRTSQSVLCTLTVISHTSVPPLGKILDLPLIVIIKLWLPEGISL